MLSPKPQLSLRNAKGYFREHLTVGDYYAEGQKVTGEWFGEGAEKLGLKGAVKEVEFLRLCDGLHPATGERLTLRKNAQRQEDGQAVANRRVFYDFTISPPKSVSVVALYQDDRILELHNRAVRQAMIELEKFAETRVRTAGGNADRPTGNIIGAAFRHDTSRELDPHLHTHCVLLNATFDPVEKRWKALQASAMYRAQKFAENLYYHELCKGLRGLGYEIENNARDFEIKGVPASVVARFSKRHQQIDEEAQKRVQREGLRTDVNTVRRQIARDARRRKSKDATADRLRPHWEKQLTPDEAKAMATLKPAKSGSGEQADVAAAVAWADEHLFERRSVVNDYELMAAALARGRGEAFELAGLREALDKRHYVRETGTRKLTSREVLRCELEIIVAAHDGRRRHGPLNPDYKPAAALSPEQRAAVDEILGSRDFITLFRGGAGTGKSFTLKEVERGLTAVSHPVVVLAPQRQQVRDLQADGLPAETIARFLQMRHLPRGAVVIVDEAGQIGGKQLREMVGLVQANAGRLILSGDTRQHGAVAASDALRAIEKHAGIKPAVIGTIRRQDPALGKSAKERGFIRGYRAAVKAASKGHIAESFDRLDRLGCIRECGADERRDALAAEYLAALARHERALVVAQTREEVRAVNDTIRSQLREAGTLGADATIQSHQILDLSDAQKRDPRFYQSGHHASFIQRYGRFAKGELCEIVGANERGLVLRKDGRHSTLSYRYTNRLVVTAATDMNIAPGDRLQLKINGKSAEGAPLNNGELVTVRRVRQDGAVTVEGDDGTRKTLAPSQCLVTRGYAVTSYASQGKTVDAVILGDAIKPGATNANQWYVTISRGRKRVVVFTSDKDGLRAHIQRAGDRELALGLKPEAPVVRPQVSGWTRRALAAIERTRLHNAVMARVRRHDQRQRIAP